MYKVLSLYLLLLCGTLRCSVMQNGHCSFTNGINQYHFFFIVFRLYVPFKTFWERKCEFPCVFHWTSQDVSQINDEFIFTISSGKKDALVFTNFQVKNWGRERFKALKIHWFEGPPVCSVWSEFSLVEYLPQDFEKYIEMCISMTCFPKPSAVAVTESPDLLQGWVSIYISPLHCPKLKKQH